MGRNATVNIVTFDPGRTHTFNCFISAIHKILILLCLTQVSPTHQFSIPLVFFLYNLSSSNIFCERIHKQKLLGAIYSLILAPVQQRSVHLDFQIIPKASLTNPHDDELWPKSRRDSFKRISKLFIDPPFRHKIIY